MKTQKFEVVSAQSNIDWIGRKVTGKHNGTIGIKAGTLLLTEGQLNTARFVIDTNSIRILDVTDPATNAQFAGHLASDDFFSISTHPEAILEIRSVEENQVLADLTIKGITHPITFTVLVNVTDDTLTASAKLVVDRTLYDMKFRSGNFFQNLGDNLIYNDFELNVHLTAKAVNEPALA